MQVFAERVDVLPIILRFEEQEQAQANKWTVETEEDRRHESAEERRRLRYEHHRIRTPTESFAGRPFLISKRLIANYTTPLDA